MNGVYYVWTGCQTYCMDCKHSCLIIIIVWFINGQWMAKYIHVSMILCNRHFYSFTICFTHVHCSFNDSKLLGLIQSLESKYLFCHQQRKVTSFTTFTTMVQFIKPALKQATSCQIQIFAQIESEGIKPIQIFYKWNTKYQNYLCQFLLSSMSTLATYSCSRFVARLKSYWFIEILILRYSYTTVFFYSSAAHISRTNCPNSIGFSANCDF